MYVDFACSWIGQIRRIDSELQRFKNRKLSYFHILKSHILMMLCYGFHDIFLFSICYFFFCNSILWPANPRRVIDFFHGCKNILAKQNSLYSFVRGTFKAITNLKIIRRQASCFSQVVSAVGMHGMGCCSTEGDSPYCILFWLSRYLLKLSRPNCAS